MTKQEKINVLTTAMKQSERDDKTEYYHFTPEAPEELQNLFLEHYEIRDIDYMIFSRACDVVNEAYRSEYKNIDDGIYEQASDSASYYTAERLTYLNIWNQDEISDMIKNEGAGDIATACAMWYDRQVEQASFIINEWINA